MRFGVSQVYSKRLANLGVNTVSELLYLFPRRYDDFTALKKINELQYGDEVTVVAQSGRPMPAPRDRANPSSRLSSPMARG